MKFHFGYPARKPGYYSDGWHVQTFQSTSLLSLFYSFKTMSEVKEQIQQFSSKAEDLLDAIGQPLRPYIPAMSRFLIVATFLEDSLRIITQWSDQVFYMERHRGFFWGFSHLFLTVNVLVRCRRTMLTRISS